MKYIILLSVLLTGCATKDSETFQKVRNHYNYLDQCQFYGKPDGYKIPSYCFTNAGKRVYSVYDLNNRIVFSVH